MQMMRSTLKVIAAALAAMLISASAASAQQKPSGPRQVVTTIEQTPTLPDSTDRRRVAELFSHTTHQCDGNANCYEMIAEFEEMTAEENINALCQGQLDRAYCSKVITELAKGAARNLHIALVKHLPIRKSTEWRPQGKYPNLTKELDGIDLTDQAFDTFDQCTDAKPYCRAYLRSLTKIRRTSTNCLVDLNKNPTKKAQCMAILDRGTKHLIRLFVPKIATLVDDPQKVTAAAAQPNN